MCSVEPDEVVEMTRATRAMDITSGDVRCRKCGDGVAQVVLRLNHPYCRECFLAYLVHKFRSTIGKSRQVRHGDRVLVATSGGASSAAVTHLIRHGLDETSHKQLKFIPAFIYVDESCLSDTPGEGPAALTKVCGEVVKADFQCYVTSLHQVMSPADPQPVLFTEKSSLVEQPGSEGLKDKLRDLVHSCRSESSKLALVEALRLQVVLGCAKVLGYDKVFLGDNATSLSVAILDHVAQGRGSQLPQRVHFKSVQGGVEVLRPLREVLEDEVQHYVALHSLPVTRAPQYTPKGPSITSCTRDFVVNLQREFPATIPTIFRTGDKLTSSSDHSQRSTPASTPAPTPVPTSEPSDPNEELCVMCGSMVDTDQGEASAVHAIVVSQGLSRPKTQTNAEDQKELNGDAINGSYGYGEDGRCGDNGGCGEGGGCGGGGGGCGDGGGCGSKGQEQQRLTKELIEPYLCYGCRIILREMSVLEVLPARVCAAALERHRWKAMRDQIQDFLL